MPQMKTSNSISSLNKSKFFAYHQEGMFSQGYAIVELLRLVHSRRQVEILDKL